MNYLDTIRYYMYSPDDKKYFNKTPTEMKEFLDGLDKDKLHIIGTFDRYKPQNLEELEL